ncbi:MAG: hypothetical protein H7836_13970 [Magnetococcus sp. YQC-3]
MRRVCWRGALHITGMLLWEILCATTPAWAESVALDSTRTNEQLVWMAQVEPIFKTERNAIRVHLYRLWEGPWECDDEPESCPRQRLCILIQRIDFPEQRNVYLLPVSFGWSDPRIVHEPKSLEGGAKFTLLIQEDVPSKNPLANNRTTWFEHKTRTITFNLQEAFTCTDPQCIPSE